MMNFEKSVEKLFTVTRGTTISSLQKEGCRGCRVILIDRFSWHHNYLVFDTTGEVWRPKMFVLTWGTRSSASTGSHCHLHSWTPWQWHGILMSRNALERSLKKCIYGTVIRWIRRTWVSACGTYYFRLLPQHWSKNLRPLQAHQEQWSSPTNEGNEESIVKNASKTKQHVAVHGLLTQSEVPILGALFF